MKLRLDGVNQWIFKNLTWILVILALILFLISSTDFLGEKISPLMEKAGLAILSSGIFSAILKSLQFTGLFRDEIKKVMAGSAFIENRSDLPEIWREISKSLYKKKFPKISQLLEDTILNTYFPTKAKFYYENYNVSVNIEEISDNFEISYTQICEYRVIMDKDADTADLVIENQISDDDPGSTIINELVYFKVNDVDISLEEDSSTKDDPKKSLYKYTLANGKEFAIKAKYKRRYPLKNENFKLFRLKYITHGMQVSVSYPKDVRVSFFPIGLVNNFKPINEDFKFHICRLLINDLILPHQGFGMSFEKTNDETLEI